MNRESIITAAILMLAAACAKAAPDEAEIRHYCDSVAVELSRPASFRFRGYSNPEMGNKFHVAVTGPFENKTHEIAVDSEGRFSMTLPMLGPIQEMYVYYRNVVSLPVHPGDTIIGFFDNDSISFSGTTQEVRRDMKFATEAYHKFRRPSMENISSVSSLPYSNFQSNVPDSLSAPLIERTAALARSYNAMVDSVENADGPLRSSEYFRIATYFDLLQPYAMHPLVEALRYADKPGQLQNLAIESYKYLPYSYIRYNHYRHFMDFLVSGYAGRLNNVLQAASPMATDDTEESIIAVMASDPAMADYILTRRALMKFEVHPYETAMESAERSLPHIRAGVYKEMIDSVAASRSVLAIGRPAPQLSLIDSKGRKMSLDDFKGKFVYLDFWNEGCRPCYEEFKLLPELRERYKEHLDRLAIITVCSEVRSDGRWHELIEQHSLKDEINTRPDLSASHACYDIKAWPTYMLIDPEGRIVKSNFERPTLLLYGYVGIPNPLDKALGITSAPSGSGNKSH